MPRVHHVRKAAKTHRKLGIKKGSSYFWWYGPKPRGKGRGVKRVSLTRPRPSQLTQSEFLSAIYGAEEQVTDAMLRVGAIDDAEAEGDLDGDSTGSYADIFDKSGLLCILQEAKDAVDEQRSECESKVENVREKFPNGCPSLEILQARIGACETISDAIDTAISEVESAETVADVEQAVDGIDWSCE